MVAPSLGIRQHLQQFWPERLHDEFEWMRGPVDRSLPGFRVRRVAPAIPSEPWVYVSVGAWQATSGESHCTEFLLLSPQESSLHVELLAMVAHFHADPSYRLSVGSTLDIGRPWLHGSDADHLLVSRPYPYGPALEHCDLGDRHIRFLWLVPVTAGEAALARRDGLEALERLLEQPGVDVISPTRRSLV